MLGSSLVLIESYPSPVELVPGYLVDGSKSLVALARNMVCLAVLANQVLVPRLPLHVDEMNFSDTEKLNMHAL